MKKFSLLAISLLLTGASLKAQYPCSTFENPSPAGNWVATACTDVYVNTNTLDGSQCVTLFDDSGGSWYTNTVDYNNLGQNYIGKCLCFDYYLIDDGDPGTVAFNPTIYLSDGINTIAFVSSTTVYEGTTGWIHVCAPIQHCTGSTLPSNGDGTWTMGATMTCADFNHVLDNVTSVGFPTDITSCPCEEMSIDNVCVRDCNNCHTDFSLQTDINTSTGQVSGTIFLLTTDPGVTYKVDWGDGFVSGPYVSHLYAGPGTYKVCVSEYDQKGNLLCCTCVSFTFGKPTYGDCRQVGGGGGGELGRMAAPGGLTLQRSMTDKLFTGEAVFEIFPNPSKEYADVMLPKTKGAVTIRVTDLFGKVVSETTLKAGDSNRKVRISTDKLAEGIYNVEITSGSQVSSQKISVVK